MSVCVRRNPRHSNASRSVKWAEAGVGAEIEGQKWPSAQQHWRKFGFRYTYCHPVYPSLREEVVGLWDTIVTTIE